MLMAMYATMPARTAAAAIAEIIIPRMLIQASSRRFIKGLNFIPEEIYHKLFLNKTLRGSKSE
jgi:hypothetical protein